MRTSTQLGVLVILAGLGYAGWHYQETLKPLIGLKPTAAQTAGAPGGGPPGGGRGPGGPGGPGGQAPVVEVLPVAKGVITETTEAVGTTRAFESVQINAKISGIVEAVLFEEGTQVKQGDELLRIDGAERRADADAAKAAVSQEEAKRQELRTKLDRARALRRSGAGTEAVVDDLEAQVKTSDSAIQNAIAREKASRSRVNDVVVRAPFAGRVGIRNVSVGTFLDTRTNITTLDDISRIRLDFSIPETLVSRIQPGALIKASSIAFGKREFEGKVTVVDTRIDPVTRAVKLTALIENQDQQLRPGMFMNIVLEVAKRENALLIAEEAVVGEGPIQIVFAVKDGKVERRVVKLGQREGGKVEVLEGVALDEPIIVRGLHRARGGIAVTARPLGAAPQGGPPGGPGRGQGGPPGAGGPGGGSRPGVQSAAPVGAAQAAGPPPAPARP
jgi:membrane fusion protein, multidrug efflux system